MRVLVPSQLLSYTGGAREVDAKGATLAAVLAQLDARYPGLRFRIVDEQDRIRQHIRFFVNGEEVESVEHRLGPADEIQILGALSGG